MEPFAVIGDLTARLDWTLDEDEMRAAEGALEDASNYARMYGKAWEDGMSAPFMVKTIVLTVCVRYMKNLGGYTQSRAGDETLGFTDLGENAGAIYFTEQEQKLLAALAGKHGGIVSVPIFAWGTKLSPTTGYVPVSGEPGEKPFPYFADGAGAV